jgi:hypothetical protein
MTPEEITSWITAHPYATAGIVLYLALTAFGNLTMPEAVAVANPRLASAWVVAQRIGALCRGLLKPVVGLVIPSVARDVVSQIYPTAFGPPTPRAHQEPPK